MEAFVSAQLTDNRGQVTARTRSSNDKPLTQITRKYRGIWRGRGCTPFDDIIRILDAFGKGMFGSKTIVDIDTDSAVIASEEPAILVLVREVAHGPAAFMVHDNYRAACGRLSYGNIYLDRDGRAVSRGNVMHTFGHLIVDRARNRIEVPEF
jgi:hypothetical protein